LKRLKYNRKNNTNLGIFLIFLGFLKNLAEKILCLKLFSRKNETLLVGVETFEEKKRVKNLVVLFPEDLIE